VRYQPLPHVVAEPIGNELVLLDLDSGMAFRLNATGRRVWELAQQRQTAAEIARELTTLYGITGAQAQTDVTEILTQLVHDRLMAPLGDSSGETGS
jgi:hypothetical protein